MERNFLRNLTFKKIKLEFNLLSSEYESHVMNICYLSNAFVEHFDHADESDFKVEIELKPVLQEPSEMVKLSTSEVMSSSMSLSSSLFSIAATFFTVNKGLSKIKQRKHNNN